MRRALLLTLSAALAVCGIGAQTHSAETHVIIHRQALQAAPQNRWAALKQAVRCGADRHVGAGQRRGVHRAQKRRGTRAPGRQCGGSPAATMWAAYELAERWGVRFLIVRDALPSKRIWPGLPDIDPVMEPNMRIRCWRLVSDLAHGPVSWSLAENRRFLHQIAKMKYNRIHVSLWPTQPFVHYTFRGLAKPPGVLYFGQRHRIDSDTIGREKFGRMKVFTNPELVGADTPQELRRRAVGTDPP